MLLTYLLFPRHRDRDFHCPCAVCWYFIYLSACYWQLSRACGPRIIWSIVTPCGGLPLGGRRLKAAPRFCLDNGLSHKQVPGSMWPTLHFCRRNCQHEMLESFVRLIRRMVFFFAADKERYLIWRASTSNNMYALSGIESPQSVGGVIKLS